MGEKEKRRRCKPIYLLIFFNSVEFNSDGGTLEGEKKRKESDFSFLREGWGKKKTPKEKRGRKSKETISFHIFFSSGKESGGKKKKEKRKRALRKDLSPSPLKKQKKPESVLECEEEEGREEEGIHGEKEDTGA